MSIATDTSAVRLPFDPSRGLVEVEVVINGSISGRFGIDTGADDLYIDSTFAAENGLRFVRNARDGKISGGNGNSSARALELRSLNIGDMPTLTSVAGTVTDLRAMYSQPGFEPPDGLIGHTLLQQYMVTVDYADHTLELGSSLPRSLAGRVSEQIPFDMLGHLPLVTVMVGDSALLLGVDYCATHLFLTPAAANRCGLKPDASGRVTVPQARLGRHGEVRDVEAAIDPALAERLLSSRRRIDGLIGGTFLEQLVLTIDYRSQIIYLHR